MVKTKTYNPEPFSSFLYAAARACVQCPHTFLKLPGVRRAPPRLQAGREHSIRLRKDLGEMSKEGLKRGVVCAVAALAVSLALWGRAAQTQGQQQGDRPVEQTRKNIQVLKGLPESQLFPEMNFISTSLGVQCGFCHVSKGKDPKTGFTNWVWESDDKEEKKTARDMMRMVLAVNGGNFGLSRGAVTCYTCHRGQEHPQNMPTLPLAASGHEPAPGATPTPQPGAAPATNAP